MANTFSEATKPRGTRKNRAEHAVRRLSKPGQRVKRDSAMPARRAGGPEPINFPETVPVVKPPSSLQGPSFAMPPVDANALGRGLGAVGQAVRQAGQQTATAGSLFAVPPAPVGQPRPQPTAEPDPRLHGTTTPEMIRRSVQLYGGLYPGEGRPDVQSHQRNRFGGLGPAKIPPPPATPFRARVPGASLSSETSPPAPVTDAYSTPASTAPVTDAYGGAPNAIAQQLRARKEFLRDKIPPDAVAQASTTAPTSPAGRQVQIDGESYTPLGRPAYGEGGGTRLPDRQVGAGVSTSGQLADGSFGSGLMRGAETTAPVRTPLDPHRQDIAAINLKEKNPDLNITPTEGGPDQGGGYLVRGTGTGTPLSTEAKDNIADRREARQRFKGGFGKYHTFSDALAAVKADEPVPTGVDQRTKNAQQLRGPRAQARYEEQQQQLADYRKHRENMRSRSGGGNDGQIALAIEKMRQQRQQWESEWGYQREQDRKEEKRYAEQQHQMEMGEWKRITDAVRGEMPDASNAAMLDEAQRRFQSIYGKPYTPRPLAGAAPAKPTTGETGERRDKLGGLLTTQQALELDEFLAPGAGGTGKTDSELVDEWAEANGFTPQQANLIKQEKGISIPGVGLWSGGRLTPEGDVVPRVVPNRPPPRGLRGLTPN